MNEKVQANICHTHVQSAHLGSCVLLLKTKAWWCVSLIKIIQPDESQGHGPIRHILFLGENSVDLEFSYFLRLNRIHSNKAVAAQHPIQNVLLFFLAIFKPLKEWACSVLFKVFWGPGPWWCRCGQQNWECGAVIFVSSLFMECPKGLEVTS